MRLTGLRLRIFLAEPVGHSEGIVFLILRNLRHRKVDSGCSASSDHPCTFVLGSRIPSGRDWNGVCLTCCSKSSFVTAAPASSARVRSPNCITIQDDDITLGAMV